MFWFRVKVNELWYKIEEKKGKYSISCMENILKILKRRETNIQYHGSWDERENEVLLVENYTSTQLEPGICSFPQKTWEIHIFTILLHFLRIKH